MQSIIDQRLTDIKEKDPDKEVYHKLSKEIKNLKEIINEIKYDELPQE